MSTYDDGDHQGGAGNDNAGDAPILTDAELLQRFRAGDSDAFETLWRRAYKPALGAARALGAASPEDVVDEAFTCVLDIMRNGGGPTDDFMAYLYQTIRNIVHAPSTYRRETLADGEIPEMVGKDNVEEAALVKLEHERIKRVFTAMPQREAQLLIATEMRGMPVGQAAATVGVSANYASVILKRGKRSFQRLWFQEHTQMPTGKGVTPECRWVLSRAGAYLAKTLPPTKQKRCDTHLKQCDACAVAITEVRRSSMQWGKALAGGTVSGLLPSGFAATAWGAPLPALAIGSAVVAGAVGLTVIGLPSTVDETDVPEPVVSTSVQTTSPPSATSPAQTPSDSPSPDETTTTSGPTASRPPSSQAPSSQAPSSQTPSPAAPPPVTISLIGVSGTDNGPGGLCYPQVNGTAEPGATLKVAGIGWSAQVGVGADGRWVTPPLTAMHPGTVWVNISYVTTPVAGPATTPGPARWEVSLVVPPSLSVSQTAEGLSLYARGEPGGAVEILLDGALATTVTLDGAGHANLLLPTPAPGPHTMTARYAPPGCTGPNNTLTVSVV